MEDNNKYKGLRNQLINSLFEKGINSEVILNVMEKVPRHYFMDPGLIDFAYEDKAYPISSGQTISQPYTVAFQSQLLDIRKEHKILEIGTGSGYQTAVLLGVTPKVYTIERKQELFKKTKHLFIKLNLRPKKFVFGDGYNGLPNSSPFDRILVTAGAPTVPKELLRQLKLGGKLVIPLGIKNQKMVRFTKLSENEFDKETFGNFRFVPLLSDKN